MSAVHTPGPWRVDPDNRPGMEWNNHIFGADGMCVCFMAHDGDGINKRGEANAHLIAAAPELLAALELFAHASMSGSNGDGESHIGWQRGEGLSARERVQQARAAIAKARGQS